MKLVMISVMKIDMELDMERRRDLETSKGGGGGSAWPQRVHANICRSLGGRAAAQVIWNALFRSKSISPRPILQAKSISRLPCLPTRPDSASSHSPILVKRDGGDAVPLILIVRRYVTPNQP